jgi:hypothetical protein
MGLNQSWARGPGNHNLHLGQEALSPCLLVVAVKAKAGEAFLPHGGTLKGWLADAEENQKITDRPRGRD